MEETKKYNFDDAIANEETTKVQSAAVTRAKQKIEEEQLERDAREVQRRLTRADEDVKNAERAGRYASKKKNILKKYSEALVEAKNQFETDGDWKAYDKKISDLKNEKDKSIRDAKEAVYGDDSWCISD